MTITWDNPDELEEYISRLQSAADRLTSENRRLRKCHGTLVDKVRTTLLYKYLAKAWSNECTPIIFVAIFL